eukprot:jgi/Undpi1/12445/HiC_scaffold_5.g02116.m1
MVGIKCSRVVLALAAVALASGDLADDFNIPEGWRMEDRYHGFRYKASVGEGCQQYEKAAQAAADELACFGWVQRPGAGTMVGEGRCSKATGKHMLERLRMGPGDGCEVGPFEVKDYPDTKIKLHFSHFKILGVPDTPHKCPEFPTSQRRLISVWTKDPASKLLGRGRRKWTAHWAGCVGGAGGTQAEPVVIATTTRGAIRLQVKGWNTVKWPWPWLWLRSTPYTGEELTPTQTETLSFGNDS